VTRPSEVNIEPSVPLADWVFPYILGTFLAIGYMHAVGMAAERPSFARARMGGRDSHEPGNEVIPMIWVTR
jgi:hypothetical protein